MLLSLIISFAVSRRFQKKLHVCALLLTAVALISFFSAGVPHYYFVPASSLPFEASGIRFDAVLPLSFPLYAQLSTATPDTSPIYEFYQLYFFTLMFHEYWVAFLLPGRTTLYLSWSGYIFYLSLFLIINSAGAVIGYLLSKKSFRRQVLTAVKPTRNLTITLTTTAFLMFSLYSFYNAYHLWSGFEWAMRRLAGTRLAVSVPSPVSQVNPIREYITLFHPYFFAGLVALTLTLSLVMVTLNTKRRIFLIASTLVVSSVFFFYGGYKVWEIYQWGIFLDEATNAYATYFPLYLQLGLMTTAAGLILITIGLRLRRKKRQNENSTLPTLNSPNTEPEKEDILC